MEDYETSLILKNGNPANQKQNQNQDVLSAEDLAWADSCLIEDLEISETNMNSLKEALLDILDQHSQIFLGRSSNDITDPENLPSVIEEETSHTAETIIDDGELEQETEEGCDVLSILKQQPFLPNYNDKMMNVQYSDDGHDDDDDVGFVLSELVMEPLSDDIFKVWDLDIPVEEEVELDKQLKEAFSSNAGTRVPKKKKGLKLESLDILLESLAELCLK